MTKTPLEISTWASGEMALANSRRRCGLVLMLGVRLVALAVPIANGRRIAGQPIAAPIVGPPQVGDCLTWTPPWGGPPVAASRVLDGSAAGHAEAATADDRASTRMVSCGDSRQGEIVRTAMDVGGFPVTTLIRTRTAQRTGPGGLHRLRCRNEGAGGLTRRPRDGPLPWAG